MWKQKPESVAHSIPVPTPEPVRAVPPANVDNAARTRPVITQMDQATLSKGIVIRGEISGVDPLYVDGRVEGSINVPGERVTIGRHGSVIAAKPAGAAPCIVAREVVLIGTVTGNITATERVEIRSEACLIGDVSTARVSIEDGAQFRGGIDIRREPAPRQTAEPPAVLDFAETIQV